MITAPSARRRPPDVLQLDDAEASKVKRWAIRALVEAARKSTGQD